MDTDAKKDFFVSYNRHDKTWAEWFTWILEEAGYSVVIQAWDFRPRGNFVLDMQRAASQAERTIAVLSQNYLNSQFVQPEWAAAFAQDPVELAGIGSAAQHVAAERFCLQALPVLSTRLGDNHPWTQQGLKNF